MSVYLTAVYHQRTGILNIDKTLNISGEITGYLSAAFCIVYSEGAALYRYFG